jgi:hypothetical protein
MFHFPGTCTCSYTALPTWLYVLGFSYKPKLHFATYCLPMTACFLVAFFPGNFATSISWYMYLYQWLPCT